MSTRPTVGNDQMRERGGAEGTRTPDPLIANEVLSQLSYSPVPQGADNAQSNRRKSSGPESYRLRTESPLVSFHRPLGDPPPMMALFWLVDRLLSLYIWAVILAAVFSILTSFGVLDTRNRLVWTIGDFLYRITEPALRPIRNLLPNLGGIDVSPIILILLIQVARMLLGKVYAAIATGLWSSVLL